MAGKTTLRFGVLGTGRIGRIHATNIAHRVTSAELVAVADIDRAAADRLAAELGCSHVFTDYRGVLVRPDIDAVVVCTPTATHFEVIMAAAAAGKMIFAEKPIDLDL